MSRAFLGSGWAFPVAVGQNGEVRAAAQEQSIRESIWLILSTAPGERVMRPDFGCGIHDLVFERNTRATAGRVAQAIREALLAFEPRIDVVDVTIESLDGGERMEITVEYRVRTTNNVFNLVYPFYLEQGTSR